MEIAVLIISLDYHRLVHFKDTIANIDIGLDGRDKELCKPLLQLFDNSQSYTEIESALQKFLDAKNQKKEPYRGSFTSYNC